MAEESVQSDFSTTALPSPQEPFFAAPFALLNPIHLLLRPSSLPLNVRDAAQYCSLRFLSSAVLTFSFASTARFISMLLQTQ